MDLARESIVKALAAAMCFGGPPTEQQADAYRVALDALPIFAGCDAALREAYWLAALSEVGDAVNSESERRPFLVDVVAGIPQDLHEDVLRQVIAIAFADGTASGADNALVLTMAREMGIDLGVVREMAIAEKTRLGLD